MRNGTGLGTSRAIDRRELAAAAAHELVLRLERVGVTSGRVVDLGCGTGVFAAALTRLGFEVLGIDVSAEALRVARAAAPDATFLHASLFEVDLPECVAITAIGEAINDALEEETDPELVGALLDRVHDRLSDNGVAMLDVATTNRIGAGEIRTARIDRPDRLTLVHEEGSSDGQHLSRRVTAFELEPDGVLWRRNDQARRQRLLTPEGVTERLLTAGFHVEVVSGYGEIVFPEGWTGFLASKRARPLR